MTVENNSDEIFKFEINVQTPESENVKKGDDEEFFKCFSLYLDRKNAQSVEKEIEKEFEKKFGSSRWAANYIEFFKHCHDGVYRDRKIDKKTVKIQLIDLLLSMERMSFRSDARLTNFQEMMKKVKLIVVNLDVIKYDKTSPYAEAHGIKNWHAANFFIAPYLLQ
jgi:phosphoenolpyruvate-protein kinase (PTS system EI component)